MELTIGSDDGLVVGHELVHLSRSALAPNTSAKSSIVTVDPDQSVAKVVGKTYLGKKD